MPLETIMEFINEKANNIHIDSFSSLVSHLGAIPGIKTFKVAKNQRPVNKRLVKKLSGLFTPHVDKAPEGFTLEVKHFIHYHYIVTDYEVGFYDHRGKWICLAWGWYNQFVGAMHMEPAALYCRDTAPATILPKSALT